ncbi:MAG: multidrug transporter [Alphaproteobacteria bacterium]|nr:MAG: multidrug transporter [Alphaproteobacteria bacterium]
MKRGLRLLTLFTVLAALALIVYALRQAEHRPHTDAAQVSAPIIRLSTTVPGRVVEVMVENNQLVNAGDPLFRVDPEPYELELVRAQAALATAQSELAQGQRNLELERSNAEVADNQIARARNNLALAQQTLARLEPLLSSGYVTAQEVDTARTSVSDALVTLEQALAHAEGTREFVGTLDTRLAQVDLTRASVALAERNLRNTVLYAPVTGRVTGLTLNAGEYVVTGTVLFSLVDTAHWHVTALFRETDLPVIREGSEAQVFLLAAPDTPIKGTVTGIGWAIRSGEEAHIMGLPAVANRIDWVRTARRFPVEVLLHDPPADLTRVGISASVRIVGDGGQAAPHDPHAPAAEHETAH